jgi:DNA (cytosine-5)-methyltransferase 1
MATPKLTVFALFSGAGGLHLGLENAGFKIIGASDIEPMAAKTHKLNRPKIPFLLEDARKLSGATLIATAGNVTPDLIAGGPPCQGFSTLGDKLSGDPRNQLFAAFARIVEEVGPRFVLMENVKSLTTMYGGRYKDFILQTFERLGYRMHCKVLDAADYGVPQFRKRVIFFGTKHTAPFTFPESTHGPTGKAPYATTWEAIWDLALDNLIAPNHTLLQHSEKVVARYALIPEGGRLPPPHELPEAIRRNNFGNTYKRLHRNKPSLTMVPGNNAFPIHPTLNRSLTPREAARLQSFSDDVLFAGDRRRQCILVGNAVPPLLAMRIGTAIIQHSKAAIATNIDPLPISTSVIKPIKQKAVGCFVDLFCGAGGIGLGFDRAGWTPVLSVDLNPHASLTHKHNHPRIPYIQGDLSEKLVRSNVIKSLESQKIAVIVGGPPCQGFSIFGKRRFVNTRGHSPHDDQRNKLVFAYLEMVKALKPRWFVMENVPGLANLGGGKFLEVLLSRFRAAGYSQIEARILNAADYGVPQLRKRLLIIGNLTGHIIPWPKRKFFAKPEEWQDPYRTVGEVISDLATIVSLKKFTCHVPMNHKPLLVERYNYIPEGGRLDVDALPAHLKSGYRTTEVKNYSHVFKRLHRDRPATTMVPGHNAFPIHPWLNRALTVREAARIQTFPDEVEFLGPRQEQCIQVGNAFPPLLAEIIGNNIKKAEVNDWFPGRVPPSAYYSLVEKENVTTLLATDQMNDETFGGTV